jgi:hypothetical protein
MEIKPLGECLILIKSLESLLVLARRLPMKLLCSWFEKNYLETIWFEI